jgi:hypothetical protein
MFRDFLLHRAVQLSRTGSLLTRLSCNRKIPGSNVGRLIWNDAVSTAGVGDINGNKTKLDHEMWVYR